MSEELKATAVSNNWCQVGNHAITDLFSGYVWSDEEHGYPNDVRICRRCYALKMLEYYPDSKITKHILDNKNEYGIGEMLKPGDQLPLFQSVGEKR